MTTSTTTTGVTPSAGAATSNTKMTTPHAPSNTTNVQNNKEMTTSTTAGVTPSVGGGPSNTTNNSAGIAPSNLATAIVLAMTPETRLEFLSLLEQGKQSEAYQLILQTKLGTESLLEQRNRAVELDEKELWKNNGKVDGDQKQVLPPNGSSDNDAVEDNNTKAKVDLVENEDEKELWKNNGKVDGDQKQVLPVQPTQNGSSDNDAVEEKNMKAKVDFVEKELSKIVGMDELKSQLNKYLKGMLLDQTRRSLGFEVGARAPPHMAFLGNPGTGKTSVARMLGRLLHSVGILSTDKVIEVQRTDLVGQYIGQTGVKTRTKIKEAEGGILFVDEAYRLIKDSKVDYGTEALEEIMSVMDGGKLAVIFAGYRAPMEKVISSNEGLRRRVTNLFYFDDFTCQDLAKILHLKLSNGDQNSCLHAFKLHPSCSLEAVAKMIELETTVKQRREMNGGLVDQMLVRARDNLDSRIDAECKDKDSLLTITSEDLEAALWLLKATSGKRKGSVKREKSDIGSVAKAKMDALEKELSKIVGLDPLKLQLEKWLKGMLVDDKCRASRLTVGCTRLPHMAFLGNPGTGKSMVAKILVKLLHLEDVLSKDNVTEVEEKELVEKYMVQIGPFCKKKVQVVEGGILFVEEAYNLTPENLEHITSLMDKGDVVVIFCGYSEPMKRLISWNEGFSRRVNKFFQFDDYSCQELAKIVGVKMCNQAKSDPLYGFKLHPWCSVEAVAAMIERETTREQRKEMNGFLVDEMLVNARENFDSRTDVESIGADFEPTITLEDLVAGLGFLTAKQDINNKRLRSFYI